MKLKSASISESIQKQIELLREAICEIILPRNGLEETMDKVSNAEEQLAEVKKTLERLHKKIESRPKMWEIDHAED